MNKHILRLMALAVPLVLGSCAAKKIIADATETVKKATGQTEQPSDDRFRQLAFVQKVSDNRLYQKNITGNMTLRLQARGKDISAPGALRMRRGEIIRLQVFMPLLGSELGRIDFTPDYVLVVDRMHKEYIKADYNQLDFLKRNGLNYYSLEALFWNELMLPGSRKVGESDLRQFTAVLDGASSLVPVTLRSGQMTCRWDAARDNGLIRRATVTYQSGTAAPSTLDWQYADFQVLGAKQFPATQQFTFKMTRDGRQQEASATLSVSKVGTAADWDATTSLSDKYKKVAPQDVLGKLMNF